MIFRQYLGGTAMFTQLRLLLNLRALLGALLLKSQTLQRSTQLFGLPGQRNMSFGPGKIGHISYGVTSHGYSLGSTRKSKLQDGLERSYTGII